MSVVKSKRTQSKIEFEMTFFKVADGVDFLVENQFFADYEQMQEHKIFISSRSIALYASLFPPHREPPKLTRSALMRQANREADTEDLKLLFYLKY